MKVYHLLTFIFCIVSGNEYIANGLSYFFSKLFPRHSNHATVVTGSSDAIMDNVCVDITYVMDGMTALTEAMNGSEIAVRNDHLISNIRTG